MGQHQKEFTLRIISFVNMIGEALGYTVVNEEPMFPDNPSSPILDITWRRSENEKFPLFIFEVESLPTKSSSDNALKVFSRKTETYAKPLFFFHLFVEAPIGTERIGYLKENYDKLNYDTYALENKDDHFCLISDILEQHFRIENRLVVCKTCFDG